jgi:hypothetical protein
VLGVELEARARCSPRGGCLAAAGPSAQVLGVELGSGYDNYRRFEVSDRIR